MNKRLYLGLVIAFLVVIGVAFFAPQSVFAQTPSVTPTPQTVAEEVSSKTFVVFNDGYLKVIEDQDRGERSAINIGGGVKVYCPCGLKVEKGVFTLVYKDENTRIYEDGSYGQRIVLNIVTGGIDVYCQCVVNCQKADPVASVTPSITPETPTVSPTPTNTPTQPSTPTGTPVPPTQTVTPEPTADPTADPTVKPTIEPTAQPTPEVTPSKGNNGHGNDDDGCDSSNPGKKCDDGTDQDGLPPGQQNAGGPPGQNKGTSSKNAPVPASTPEPPKTPKPDKGKGK